MWRRWQQRYRDWEQHELHLLAEPPAPDCAPPGLARLRAKGLAKMSPIERRQLHDFVSAYPGATLLRPMFWMCLAFSVAGLVLRQLMGSQLGWGSVLFASNAVGFACAAVWLIAWFNYRRYEHGALRVALGLLVLALLGALLGMATGVVVHGRGIDAELAKLPRVLTQVGVGTFVLVVAPLLLIGSVRNRQYRTLTAQLQRDAEQDRLARALSEAQLRLLRAQIEPHFLFNTLGAVQQLAEQGAPRAAELCANLIAFLRASLSEMRSDTVSLADEFALVDAYLRVMQARLGARLSFSLDLAPDLATFRLPGMLLLTLVENAIKHGIEPALRGGAVTVSASREADTVRLRVRDTGMGLGAGVVDGTGLENARRRLELAHHGAASLSLSDADPGTLAEIALPVST